MRQAAGFGGAAGRSFLRYMASMRRVTMKPPKMLTDASVTARRPMSLEKSIALDPAASEFYSGGAYVLADAVDGKPDVLLLATGSEVSLCIAAYEELKAAGIAARVVSMPSWELFEQQEQAYKDAVLPPDVTARVAVEKASILGWTRYTGLRGQIIGMRTFGASAPLAELQRQYGFTPGNIVAAAKEQVANART